MKYFARYVTGGPIADSRLLSHTQGMVTFLARPGTVRGGSREQVPYTLPGVEFVRRWSLHILPKGYVRTRRYGGFSNYHRERYLSDCRHGLGLSAAEEAVHQLDELPPSDSPDGHTSDKPDDNSLDDPLAPCCPGCGARMEKISSEPRLSWRTLLDRDSPWRPKWYDDG